MHTPSPLPHQISPPAGEISKYVDTLQGVAQGCTPSPSVFKAYLSDMIVAVEAAKQGVTMGENTVSAFMFVDDFVGISETPKRIAETDRKSTRLH